MTLENKKFYTDLLDLLYGDLINIEKMKGSPRYNELKETALFQINKIKNFLLRIN